MTCLLKRALPFILGLVIGLSVVFLFKAISCFTPLHSVFSGELHELDVPPIAPPDLTREEKEAFIEHYQIGLCHSYARPIDVLETVADSQLTSKAKILYLPKPDSWEKQAPCARCLVMLRATLSASGKVMNIVPMRVNSNTEYFDSSDDVRCMKNVLTAAEQIRFEPAIKNGRPVSQLVTIIYDKWGTGY